MTQISQKCRSWIPFAPSSLSKHQVLLGFSDAGEHEVMIVARSYGMPFPGPQPAFLHLGAGLDVGFAARPLCFGARPRGSPGRKLYASSGSVGPDGKARKSSFYKRPAKAIEMVCAGGSVL
jgi:hypothetical protein